MMSVINIQQGQGIRYASLLEPVLPVSALVHGEAEYRVCDNDLLIGPLLFLDLGIDVKQLIQCEKEHLWLVAISHYVFMT